MSYKSIELFAGAGGLFLGLEKAGFETVCLLDKDKDCCSTLKYNRPNINIINSDIFDFVSSNLDIYKNIDLLSGGFPCQPFSFAGNKKGFEDTRGTAFFDFAKVINNIKPKILLIENVKGLTKHDSGNTFNIIKSTLNNLGYRLHYKVLNAWDYGVAQKRERIIIVGIRGDLDVNFEFPNPHKYKPVLKDILKNVPKSDGYSYPANKKSVLDLVPPGGCHRDLPEDIAKDYMGKSYYLTGGRTGIARRISWEEPCLTLTTSPMQNQTDRCHPDETRPFTVREYARIQSFPDNWKFIGSKSSQYKQIGNAVPMNFAKEIGLSIVETLNQLEEKNLQKNNKLMHQLDLQYA